MKRTSNIHSKRWEQDGSTVAADKTTHSRLKSVRQDRRAERQRGMMTDGDDNDNDESIEDMEEEEITEQDVMEQEDHLQHPYL